MNLFSKHQISFDAIDPLADGLGDAIAAEQREAEAISSLDDTSAEELAKFWNGVVEDVKKDPTWFDFHSE